MRAFIGVVLLSIVMLIAGGYLLDVVQNNVHHYNSFFRYELRFYDHLKYWFCAAGLLVFINGIKLKDYGEYRVNWHGGFLGFIFGRPGEDGTVFIPRRPIQLLGINMALVVLLVFSFPIVRSMRI